MSEALAEIFDYQVATKKNLQDTETRLKVKIEKVRSDLYSEIMQVKSDLNSKILEVKTDLIKWMIGLLFAQSALLVSLLRFFHT